MVLAGRCVDRVGKGIRSAPRDVLLMAGAAPSDRGRIFGYHRAADTAGAVVGPAVGLGLYELLDHRIRPLLLIAVLPALLSVLLVRAVRESDPPPPAQRGPTDTADPGTAAVRRTSPPLRALTATLTLFGLINFPDALLLLRAHQLGLSTAGVITAYIAYNAVYAAAAYPAGALSDRWPRHWVFAAGYLGLGLIHSPWWVFLFLPVYGGFAACTDGVGKAWVATLAPPGQQGRAQGRYQALTGGAVVIAGLWARFAWHGTGRIPLLISGTAAAVLAVVFALTGHRPNSRPQR